MVSPIAFGIGTGLTTLVGIAAGAGAWRRATRATWIGGLLSFGVIGLMGWTVALVPESWARLFASDPAVVAASAAYITAWRRSIACSVSPSRSTSQARVQAAWPCPPSPASCAWSQRSAAAGSPSKSSALVWKVCLPPLPSEVAVYGGP